MPDTSAAIMRLSVAIEAAADYAARLAPETVEVKTITQVVTGYTNRLTSLVKDAIRTGDAVEMRRAHKALLKNVARDVYRDGLREGGIEPKDETAEDKAATDEVIDDWLASQFEYIGQFAKDAASAKKDKGLRDGALARVDTWAASLRNFGEAGKLAALGNIMLTYDGDDGAESCDDCQRYKGQRHRRNWWAERDLLRRFGNDNFECGRWEPCQHSFRDDSGKVIVS